MILSLQDNAFSYLTSMPILCYNMSQSNPFFMKKLFILFSLSFLLYGLLAYMMGREILNNWEKIRNQSSQLFITIFSICIAGVVLVAIIWLFFSQMKIEKEMRIQS